MAEEVSAAPIDALNVHVTGRRILATVVDGIVLGVLYVVMAALFGHLTRGMLPPLPAVVYAVLAILYYILLEGYLGQTVGKMLLGIRVVREDNGEVPGLGAATIRTILRIIDGLFSYLVAFIAILASRKNQRLGDMVAHTGGSRLTSTSRRGNRRKHSAECGALPANVTPSVSGEARSLPLTLSGLSRTEDRDDHCVLGAVSS